MAEGEDQQENHRYQKDLPVDRTNFTKAWKLLETYSKIPADEIDAHVLAIVSYITPLTSTPTTPQLP